MLLEFLSEHIKREALKSNNKSLKMFIIKKSFKYVSNLNYLKAYKNVIYHAIKTY